MLRRLAGKPAVMQYSFPRLQHWHAFLPCPRVPCVYLQKTLWHIRNKKLVRQTPNLIKWVVHFYVFPCWRTVFFLFSLFWIKFSDKWQISLSHWLQHWPTYLLNRWALPSYLGECKDISQQQSIKTSALTLSSTICLKQVHAARQFFICSTNKAREKKGEGG